MSMVPDIVCVDIPPPPLFANSVQECFSVRSQTVNSKSLSGSGTEDSISYTVILMYAPRGF